MCSGCPLLADIDVRGLANVQVIGDSFMDFCPSIVTLELSPMKRLTVIGSSFREQAALTSLQLPDLSSVSSLGDSFLSCASALPHVDLRPSQRCGDLPRSQGFSLHPAPSCAALALNRRGQNSSRRTSSMRVHRSRRSTSEAFRRLSGSEGRSFSGAGPSPPSACGRSQSYNTLVQSSATARLV